MVARNPHSAPRAVGGGRSPRYSKRAHRAARRRREGVRPGRSGAMPPLRLWWLHYTRKVHRAKESISIV